MCAQPTTTPHLRPKHYIVQAHQDEVWLAVLTCRPEGDHMRPLRASDALPESLWQEDFAHEADVDACSIPVLGHQPEVCLRQPQQPQHLPASITALTRPKAPAQHATDPLCLFERIMELTQSRPQAEHAVVNPQHFSRAQIAEREEGLCPDVMRTLPEEGSGTHFRHAAMIQGESKLA